jgi:tyrosyl-tRNA synthetase
MNLIAELKWRGMIQDIMPGTEEQLAKEMTAGYIGFDPTSDSLHIGSLVPILVLVHLQLAGHKPIALVGGATGMVGDPSGKNEERNLLSEEVLNHNLNCVKRQLEKFLDFNPILPNAAEVVNNYDWFRDMRFLDFIRDIGKHITVNYMSAKDSVRKRLEGENGMSFTEFTYQLVQGYDFYWLYKNKNCKLQMGGSDQWGNITTGTELIRRKSGGEAFAFTCPLLTKADGGKFGKTEKGNIWLDPAKTSPYEFYQFWLNASDADAEKWIRIFTFLGRFEIQSLVTQHEENPNARIVQKRLAKEITLFVHGEEAYNQAISTTEKLFGNSGNLSVEEIIQLPGIPEFPILKTRIEEGIDILSLLQESGSFSSKGEARKLIQQGGLKMNNDKITDPNQVINTLDLISEKFILFQKGKKSYSLVSSLNILDEFSANPNGRNLENTATKIGNGNGSVAMSSDGQLGIVFHVKGDWFNDGHDWSVRESAIRAKYFMFTYLSKTKLTFYLKVLVTSKDGKIPKEKWIRFEPSLASNDIYDPIADQEEMAYVNSVSQSNIWDKSLINIETAVSETFGQGGWVYKKVIKFRIRGEGKIKRVLFAND